MKRKLKRLARKTYKSKTEFYDKLTDTLGINYDTQEVVIYDDCKWIAIVYHRTTKVFITAITFGIVAGKVKVFSFLDV